MTAQANHKPWTRWWWFEERLNPADITSQLEWMRDNGFGGAEVAWWTHNGTVDPEAPEFLAPEWAAYCLHARKEAARLGLGLDFTFGTQWPFGGTWVDPEHAAQTWNGPSRYRLRAWWKMPAGGELPPRIMNHLDSGSLAHYAQPLAEALQPALDEGPRAALFCDSWELPTNPPLWTEGFADRFAEQFGYRVEHLMNYLEYHAQARYDYRKLLSQYVVEEFYGAFTELCHERGADSRVQCHGAPCDLLAAYAAVDIPETETILFDPHFASFAASAALIGGKPVVSCESFTAIYGLSRKGPPGFKKEQAADIKLVADAMFAHGVNRVIWHGMPYNGPGAEHTYQIHKTEVLPDQPIDRPGERRNHFGATCHVGPDAAFADELPALNAYFEKVSGLLSAGRPYAGIGVYLPLEDQWTRHLMPEEQMRPSAHYHFELQYVRFPEALRAFQPCWISMSFLPDCRVEAGGIRCGELSVPALYVDCEWLDHEALAQLLRLAREGASIILARDPREPGYVRHEDAYAANLKALKELAADRVDETVQPLLEGDELPEFRACETDTGLTIFFAHPLTKTVAYPLYYGQSFCDAVEKRAVTVNAFGRRIPLQLEFAPYQSLLFHVGRDGSVRPEAIEYTPPVPVVGQAYPKDHRYPGYCLDN